MIKSFALHWVTPARPRATQPSLTSFPEHWGYSYLTAMSPSRAQQVLWICDSALCTYVRCSQDSKSSPHPPSAICLEIRNWQAWATSWQTVLQGWGPESRQDWGQRVFGCSQFSAAKRSSARGWDCPEFEGEAASMPWPYCRHWIWEEQSLRQESPCTARDPSSSTTESCPGPGGRQG